MRTVTRYDGGAGELRTSKAQAGADARKRREELIAQGIDPDDAVVDVAPVKVLVEAYNVVSERDGEVVVREVAEDVAEGEAERLAGEQERNRQAHPIHAFIPDESATPAGEPPAMVPHDPTPHPGYRVELAPERIVTEADEEPTQ